MRERRRLLALGIAALAVLAACGGDDGAGTTAPSPTTAPALDTTVAADTTTAGGTAAPGATAATTTATAMPATSAPAEDDRRMIVLAEEPVLADVLALGFHPIAASATLAEAGFQGLDGYDTAGIEVLPMTTLSLEYVATLEPDVIVTLQFWVDQVGEDALRGLAELVTIPDGLNGRDQLEALGAALGRPEQADELAAELDEATAAAAAAVPDDCAVSLAAIYSGPSVAAFVDGPWEIPAAVLSTGCRLVPDTSQAEPDRNGRAYLSLEQLGLLDAPTMILLQSDAVDGEQASVEQVQASPLWAQLPAVQAGAVTTLDRLGYPGVAGRIRFLEELTAIVG